MLDLLEAAMSAINTPPTRAQQRARHQTFRKFMDWCQFYSVTMPPTGRDVGSYLLEMLADGATLPEIKGAANAIHAGYTDHRQFLDLVPINAALTLAAAQLAPNRTIN